MTGQSDNFSIAMKCKAPHPDVVRADLRAQPGSER
jgi:hypothetical protein